MQVVGQVPRAAGPMVREVASSRPLVAQFRSHAGPRADGSGTSSSLKGEVQGGWERLTEGPSALDLELTLPGGQAFRWSRTGRSGEWAGVVHGHPVLLRQDGAESATRGVEFRAVPPLPSSAPGAGTRRPPLRAALEDYFALSTDLDALGARFSQADSRFADIFPYLRGSRILRQEPTEALMAFICSSNNNIARISGMVAHLAAAYGDPVGTAPAGDIALHAFPTAEQMLARGLNEEDLRRNGFGYRAKYVDRAVRQLASREGGSVKYLESLRAMPLGEAHAALLELDGVGPKVASCVCLFALDKPEAVPVDVHVLRLTVQHYLPDIGGKSLTPTVYEAIQEFYREKFGDHAGWAQGILFAAELGMHRDRLPEHLRRELPPREKPKKAKRKQEEGGDAGEGAGGGALKAKPSTKVKQPKRAKEEMQGAPPRRRIRTS